MTTITKERLLTIKQWRETYGPGSNVVLPAEEAEELARIALAALEAEPVLYQSCTRPTWNSGVPWTEWKERSREGYENDLRFTDTPDHAGWINKCRKLYTTPPVPVIQADVAQAIEKLKRKLVECNRYNYCADAVKGVEYACHAAMLQGSQPVSNHEELPLDYLQGQKDGLEWAAQLAEANHPQTGDWLYDDPLELAKAIRKGPDMPEFDGPTPVTPDGWISCSERMPEETGDIIVVSDGIVMSGISYSRRDGFYIAALEYDDDEPIGGVTHWMPLPEPPQEVK
ncbi:TPA: DUF551 domain-containing protein [Escherichia coli]|nr:DUF551 domain-containing protein [Escherichia coli]HAL2142532.1 DUF551 domain-containing protein [Escherichia coli]HAL2143686.1 DUF551 domain-containing protein [Escherichia coli]